MLQHWQYLQSPMSLLVTASVKYLLEFILFHKLSGVDYCLSTEMWCLTLWALFQVDVVYFALKNRLFALMQSLTVSRLKRCFVNLPLNCNQRLSPFHSWCSFFNYEAPQLFCKGFFILNISIFVFFHPCNIEREFSFLPMSRRPHPPLPRRAFWLARERNCDFNFPCGWIVSCPICVV